MPGPPCLADAGPDGLSLQAEERGGTFDSRLCEDRRACGHWPVQTATCSNEDREVVHGNQVEGSARKQGGGSEVQVSDYLATRRVAYTN